MHCSRTNLAASTRPNFSLSHAFPTVNDPQSFAAINNQSLVSIFKGRTAASEWMITIAEVLKRSTWPAALICDDVEQDYMGMRVERALKDVVDGCQKEKLDVCFEKEFVQYPGSNVRQEISFGPPISIYWRRWPEPNLEK